MSIEGIVCTLDRLYPDSEWMYNANENCIEGVVDGIDYYLYTKAGLYCPRLCLDIEISPNLDRIYIEHKVDFSIQDSDVGFIISHGRTDVESKMGELIPIVVKYLAAKSEVKL